MNAPPRRELIASINGREVGVLREQADLWSFHYSQPWIEAADAYDLSPSLKRADGTIADGASSRPVQWFFDNLLPEEQAREVLSREARIPGSDAFGLLAYYGRESAGALTLMSRDETLAAASYLPLSDAELHRRINNRPKQSLSEGAPKKMSNAGAQDKLAIVVRGEELFHPVGNAASTHLLKPDHVNRDVYPDTVASEFFVMRLASVLGLEVPKVQIRYVPDPVYLIERSDRKAVHGETQRLHVIDACQLLGVDRTFKYRQASVETLVRCIEFCGNRARARQSLLEWSLFNLLIGNSDAHLKNLSFHVSPHGIDIAPFYDLVSTETYNAVAGRRDSWPNSELTMPIAAARTFAQVDARSFGDFAEILGVTRTATRRALGEFSARIEPAAAELYEAFEALKIPAKIVRASQLKTIRSIRMVIIREMAAKLRP